MKDFLAVCTRRFYAWACGLDSIRLLLLGYASYIALGWLVLCLPFTHQVSGLKALEAGRRQLPTRNAALRPTCQSSLLRQQDHETQRLALWTKRLCANDRRPRAP